MKKFVVLIASIVVIGLVLTAWRLTPTPPAAKNAAIQSAGQPAWQAQAPRPPATNAASQTNELIRRVESDLAINPYAGALREPGKSKRLWETNFFARFQNPQDGDAIRFELTAGRVAVGTIRITQRRDGALTYLSGELTEPEAGKFFFLTPPAGGKAGKAVGVIEFPASQTAYRIEPTGSNGDPELWQRRLDEVLCLNLAKGGAAVVDTNQILEAPPLRPDVEPLLVPSYNTNLNGVGIISLQSYPGSKAVLLLDFFGGYTPTWGGIAYSVPAAANNTTIKDLWKRVAEDYQPFNINVTTDIKVYQAAPANSRQRCCFTDTPVTAAGVAYFGSWNWGNDTVCWSVYNTGKNGGEVGTHEAGHTLGLGHDTQEIPNGTNTTHVEYYAGQGSGETGWSTIMGVGYYQPVASWSKGEYQYAGNLQDDLNVITTANNSVAYRPDDTGSTLATSRYLEVYPDASVFAEGVIERTADTDAFQFTTTGGLASLSVSPVGDWANLALMATLADAADAIIASNNPQSTLSASIVTNLPAGTYTFRVTGAGRNSPLTNGFSDYASLGYYSIAGAVSGGRQPTRLEVMEHSASGSVVGVVPAGDTNSPLVYTIVSGNSNNAFAVDNSGVVSVANSAALDYAKLATNTTLTVQYELFVNITNVATPGLTEMNRRVVIAVLAADVNQPIAATGFNAGVIAPYNATTAAPKATGFDIANNWGFYQAGLNLNPQVGGTGGKQGLPANGVVLSGVDGSRFQLGPFGGTNALMLGYTYPRFGTLTFKTPQAYNSLAILASSANGGGTGTFVITFTNGTKSPVFSLNAQDWFNNTANVSAQGFGRVRFGQPTLTTENPGWNNPNLYQTTLNLGALGFNQPIASISFTNPAGGGNQDTGIFAVSGVVMPPAANITQQPQSVTNLVPTQAATFTAMAMGAAPLAYQWYFSASGSAGSFVPLLGKTTATLIVGAELQSSNAGSYYVVVTNSINAATSSVATLTLFRAPVITQQPVPATLFLFTGQSNTLSVRANAALPTGYYWRKDGTTIAFNSISNYTLNNLQVTNTGSYSVILSNAYGAATSSVVALTVVGAPTNSSYAAAVLADKPLAYWRLDETSGTLARDYVGGNNGIYNGVTLNQPGYNPVDADRAATFGPAINSYVGSIPIDFATATNRVFSVEAWVKGNAQTTDAGIITRGQGAGGEQCNLDTGSGSHAFRFFVRDKTGAAYLANGTVGPNGTWRHVVGVCNQPSGAVLLYVDGVLNATNTIVVGSGLLSTANAMTIGSRQSGTTTYNNQFVGSIDEVAVYNYALTPNQIANHFAGRTNMAPVFAANPFPRSAATAGQPYAGTLVGTATDPNGDAVTFAKVNGPAWLSVASNGSLSGTAVSADAGPNSFVVKAIDPSGIFANATMNLSVLAAAPINLGLTWQNSDLRLSWSGGIAPYQVQVATNLESPIWQNVGSPTNVTSLLFTPSNEAAYYRVFGQ